MFTLRCNEGGRGNRENLNRIRPLVLVLPDLAITGVGSGGNGITGLMRKSREEVARLEMDSTGHE